MYNQLGEAVLKTNERMEVGIITAPDEPHAAEIKQFLGHKPGNYKWHIERCVTEVLDALETRFYVGKVDGRVITNIMTVEHQGIGILGHVFTMPEQRRKGACKGVMAYQMADFQQRKGRALYLGTGYNSHPYYIYHSFGFESVFPASGFMKYHVDEDFEARYFGPAPTQPKSVEWHDWPKITALSGIVGWDAAAEPNMERLRSDEYGRRFSEFQTRLRVSGGLRSCEVVDFVGGCDRRVGDCEP